MKNKLTISKEIYTFQALNQAIRDFAGICKLKIDDTDCEYSLELYDCVYPEETTVKEFENYLIDYTCKYADYE